MLYKKIKIYVTTIFFSSLFIRVNTSPFHVGTYHVRNVRANINNNFYLVEFDDDIPLPEREKKRERLYA
jgi:hypothetical protein